MFWLTALVVWWAFLCHLDACGQSPGDLPWATYLVARSMGLDAPFWVAAAFSARFVFDRARGARCVAKLPA